MKTIKFLPEMHEAIRNDKKTQTRRPADGPAAYEVGDLVRIIERRSKGVEVETATVLKIKARREEGLWEIGAEDALEEGVSETKFWTPAELDNRPFNEKWWDDFHFWSNYPQLVFKRLWDSIYSPENKNGWPQNPRVFVYTFEVEKG